MGPDKWISHAYFSSLSFLSLLSAVSRTEHIINMICHFICDFSFCRRRHKLDCLCAICVLKRRRREREENARLTKGQIGVSDNELGQEFKQEVQLCF